MQPPTAFDSNSTIQEQSFLPEEFLPQIDSFLDSPLGKSGEEIVLSPWLDQSPQETCHSSACQQQKEIAFDPSCSINSSAGSSSSSFGASTPRSIEPACTQVVIRPRASPGQPGDYSKDEVVITFELVESLFSKPIKDAAKIAGISLTSFKRVCRSLGVKTWPYRFHDTKGFNNASRQPVPVDKKSKVKVEEHAGIVPIVTTLPEPNLRLEEAELFKLLECSKKIWNSGPAECETASHDDNGICAVSHAEWIVNAFEFDPTFDFC